MSWLDIAITAATVFYGVVICWLSVGIFRSRRHPCRTTQRPSVSVIVAARNEAGSIGSCLAALRRQRYDGRLQVVIVDDRSTDGTGAIVDSAAGEWGTGLVCLRAPESPRYVCPKKSALAVGIEGSDGDLLLFTDADCEPPPDWVATMATCFSPGVGLVAGFACVEPLRWLRHRLLAIDNLGVSALAEGSIGMVAPLSCTGRNLAYRRSVWDEVGGFDEIGHLISGDDVYFLRLVSGRTDWRISYCAEPAAVVTGPSGSPTLGAILQQKLRHASKAARYSGGARWLGLGVYGYHGLLLAGLVLTAATGTLSKGFAIAWVLKWGLDVALLAAFAPRRGRDRRQLFFLPLVEALYIPYVLFCVPLGRSGRFRWKQEPDCEDLAPPASRMNETC